MSRPRDTKRDNKLPAYVYRKPSHDLVEYRERKDGKFIRSVYLRDENGKALHFNASVNDIWKAYARVVESEKPVQTLGWLLDKYAESPRFTRLAPSTKKNYTMYSDKVKAAPMAGGITFANVALTKITRPLIAGFRDSLSHAPIMANRLLQFLSAVYGYALEQGYVTDNPAQGVEKNPAPPRTNYVQDKDYNIAISLAPDWLRAAMELAYLCRARRGEVLGMPISAITEDGILLKRSKGSKSEIIRWSPRLRAAVDLAKSHNRSTISPWLIHSAFGAQVKIPAFNTAWRRLMEKVEKMGGQKFPFHDLKARGYSEAPEQGAGHRSAKMHDVYMRLPEKRDATK